MIEKIIPLETVEVEGKLYHLTPNAAAIIRKAVEKDKAYQLKHDVQTKDNTNHIRSKLCTPTT